MKVGSCEQRATRCTGRINVHKRWMGQHHQSIEAGLPFLHFGRGMRRANAVRAPRSGELGGHLDGGDKVRHLDWMGRTKAQAQASGNGPGELPRTETRLQWQ